MRAFVRTLLLALASILVWSAPSFAERRVALVIGNNAYSNLRSDEQLKNAVNDARAVSKTLESLGFEVVAGENLDRAAFVERLSDFAARLRTGDIAFFFFAGHGVSLNGANYILPTDIPAPRASGRGEEGRMADNAIAESRIVDRITGQGAKVVVLALDACRDNPFATAGGRSLGGERGLGRMPEAEGLMSIYSAGIGQVAWDQLESSDHNPNSVFTRVFVEVLKTPGLDLRGVAVETRRRVAELARKAGKVQIPGYYEQIDGNVYLAGPPATTTAALQIAPAQPTPALPPVASKPSEAQEQADFAVAMQKGTLAAFEGFLSAHPEGQLADIARRERARLAPPASPPPTALSANTEQADFATAMQIGSTAGFNDFLSKHPSGPLAEIARRERERLSQVANLAPPEPSPVAPRTLQPSPPPPELPLKNYGDELTDFGVRPQNRLQRNVGSPTPTTIPGATTIATRDLMRVFFSEGLLIDVLKNSGHATLPNATWLPGAGDAGNFNDTIQWKLGMLLSAATNGNTNTKLAFFCEGSRCWESYNAALRAVRLGYKQVYWYRGGLAAWTAAGLSTRFPTVTQVVQ